MTCHGLEWAYLDFDVDHCESCQQLACVVAPSCIDKRPRRPGSRNRVSAHHIELFALDTARTPERFEALACAAASSYHLRQFDLTFLEILGNVKTLLVEIPRNPTSAACQFRVHVTV